MLDCQWIQKLHTIGLLSGSFLPDEATEQLRTYCRHRANLVDQAADTTRKMQKYLRLLNLRLDMVVKDIEQTLLQFMQHKNSWMDLLSTFFNV